MLTLAALMGFAFAAGLVDAAVGGGGLIQLPALFGFLPGASAASLYGTNKLSAVCGTIFAARTYMRRVPIAWALVLPTALAAFALSFVGALLVSYIPKPILRIVVLALLLPMAVYTLWKKDFGKLHRPTSVGPRQKAQGAVIGGAIGLYDGLIGPGTGSFLMFLFVRVFGFDFLTASAHAKIVNIATNIASLCFFIPSGDVIYEAALPMIVAQIGGSYCGSWLAVHRGTGFVRVLFLILIAVLIMKTGWDVASGS
jgi:uncharacterized membrane protein YfcA